MAPRSDASAKEFLRTRPDMQTRVLDALSDTAIQECQAGCQADLAATRDGAQTKKGRVFQRYALMF